MVAITIVLFLTASEMVFVAISLISHSATSVKKTHIIAIIIAMMPHVSSFVMVKWGSMMGALRDVGIENLPNLTDPVMVATMSQ